MTNSSQSAKQQTKSSVLDAIPVQEASAQPLTPKTFLKKNGTVGFCVDIQGGFGGLGLGQVRTLERVCGASAIAPLAEAMKMAYDLSQRPGERERLLQAKEAAAQRKSASATKRGRTAATSAAASALDEIPTDV